MAEHWMVEIERLRRELAEARAEVDALRVARLAPSELEGD
jgi:hypothetical protein